MPAALPPEGLLPLRYKHLPWEGGRGGCLSTSSVNNGTEIFPIALKPGMSAVKRALAQTGFLPYRAAKQQQHPRLF